jgi:hypothetical protein
VRKQGDICRTPFEPSGLVMVIEVWDRAEPRPAARIVHLEDHPHGYKRGETGWYHADELIIVDAEIVQRGGSEAEHKHKWIAMHDKAWNYRKCETCGETEAY